MAVIVVSRGELVYLVVVLQGLLPFWVLSGRDSDPDPTAAVVACTNMGGWGG